jgi:hypothetical protein
MLQVARGLRRSLVNDTRAISRVVAKLEPLVSRPDEWTALEQARYVAQARTIAALVTRYRRRRGRPLK